MNFVLCLVFNIASLKGCCEELETLKYKLNPKRAFLCVWDSSTGITSPSQMLLLHAKNVILYIIDGVALLIAGPPSENSSTIHSKLVWQDRNIYIVKPAYCPSLAKLP